MKKFISLKMIDEDAGYKMKESAKQAALFYQHPFHPLSDAS